MTAGQGFWNERRVTGTLLVLGFILSFDNVTLLSLRTAGWSAVANPVYFQLETAFMISGVVATLLGAVMLESLLHDAGDRMLSRLGMVSFLFGAVLIVVAESLLLGGQENGGLSTIIETYVTLAFLSQAAYGTALVRTRLLPKWVGETTVLWNIAGLTGVVFINIYYFPGPGYYYPVIHYIMPLLIGIQFLSLKSSIK